MDIFSARHHPTSQCHPKLVHLPLYPLACSATLQLKEGTPNARWRPPICTQWCSRAPPVGPKEIDSSNKRDVSLLRARGHGLGNTKTSFAEGWNARPCLLCSAAEAVQAEPIAPWRNRCCRKSRGCHPADCSRCRIPTRALLSETATEQPSSGGSHDNSPPKSPVRMSNCLLMFGRALH